MPDYTSTLVPSPGTIALSPRASLIEFLPLYSSTTDLETIRKIIQCVPPETARTALAERVIQRLPTPKDWPDWVRETVQKKGSLFIDKGIVELARLDASIMEWSEEQLGRRDSDGNTAFQLLCNSLEVEVSTLQTLIEKMRSPHLLETADSDGNLPLYALVQRGFRLEEIVGGLQFPSELSSERGIHRCRWLAHFCQFPDSKGALQWVETFGAGVLLPLDRPSSGSPHLPDHTIAEKAPFSWPLKVCASSGKEETARLLIKFWDDHASDDTKMTALFLLALSHNWELFQKVLSERGEEATLCLPTSDLSPIAENYRYFLIGAGFEALKNGIEIQTPPAELSSYVRSSEWGKYLAAAKAYALLGDSKLFEQVMESLVCLKDHPLEKYSAKRGESHDLMITDSTLAAIQMLDDREKHHHEEILASVFERLLKTLSEAVEEKPSLKANGRFNAQLTSLWAAFYHLTPELPLTNRVKESLFALLKPLRISPLKLLDELIMQSLRPLPPECSTTDHFKFKLIQAIEAELIPKDFSVEITSFNLRQFWELNFSHEMIDKLEVMFALLPWTCGLRASSYVEAVDKDISGNPKNPFQSLSNLEKNLYNAAQQSIYTRLFCLLMVATEYDPEYPTLFPNALYASLLATDMSDKVISALSTRKVILDPKKAHNGLSKIIEQCTDEIIDESTSLELNVESYALFAKSYLTLLFLCYEERHLVEGHLKEEMRRFYNETVCGSKKWWVFTTMCCTFIGEFPTLKMKMTSRRDLLKLWRHLTALEKCETQMEILKKVYHPFAKEEWSLFWQISGKLSRFPISQVLDKVIKAVPVLDQFEKQFPPLLQTHLQRRQQEILDAYPALKENRYLKIGNLTVSIRSPQLLFITGKETGGSYDIYESGIYTLEGFKERIEYLQAFCVRREELLKQLEEAGVGYHNLEGEVEWVHEDGFKMLLGESGGVSIEPFPREEIKILPTLSTAPPLSLLDGPIESIVIAIQEAIERQKENYLAYMHKLREIPELRNPTRSQIIDNLRITVDRLTGRWKIYIRPSGRCTGRLDFSNPKIRFYRGDATNLNQLIGHIENWKKLRSLLAGSSGPSLTYQGFDKRRPFSLQVKQLLETTEKESNPFGICSGQTFDLITYHKEERGWKLLVKHSERGRGVELLTALSRCSSADFVISEEYMQKTKPPTGSLKPLAQPKSQSPRIIYASSSGASSSSAAASEASSSSAAASEASSSSTAASEASSSSSLVPEASSSSSLVPEASPPFSSLSFEKASKILIAQQPRLHSLMESIKKGKIFGVSGKGQKEHTPEIKELQQRICDLVIKFSQPGWEESLSAFAKDLLPHKDRCNSGLDHQVQGYWQAFCAPPLEYSHFLRPIIDCACLDLLNKLLSFATQDGDQSVHIRNRLRAFLMRLIPDMTPDPTAGTLLQDGSRDLWIDTYGNVDFPEEFLSNFYLEALIPSILLELDRYQNLREHRIELQIQLNYLVKEGISDGDFGDEILILWNKSVGVCNVYTTPLHEELRHLRQQLMEHPNTETWETLQKRLLSLRDETFKLNLAPPSGSSQAKLTCVKAEIEGIVLLKKQFKITPEGNALSQIRYRIKEIEEKIQEAEERLLGWKTQAASVVQKSLQMFIDNPNDLDDRVSDTGLIFLLYKAAMKPSKSWTDFPKIPIEPLQL